MILLRGGNKGNEEDFFGADHIDHEVLGKLPYISWLIGESGPFGGANYAFILRMKPLGVARPHIDSNPAWFEPFRVHVPIITNDKAYLLSRDVPSILMWVRCGHLIIKQSTPSPMVMLFVPI